MSLARRRTKEIPRWMSGLDVRIAKLLMWQGFKDPASIKTALDSGEYFTRIGEHTRAKIFEWLATLDQSKFDVMQLKGPVRRLQHPTSGRHQTKPCFPSKLLDFVKMKLELKTDVQLSSVIGISCPYLSKLRRSKSISPKLLLQIHMASGIDLETLKQVLWSSDDSMTLVAENRHCVR